MRMTSLVFALFLSFAGCAQGPESEVAEVEGDGSQSAAEPASQTYRILFLTHSAGFKHDVLPHAAEMIQDQAGQYGIEVEVSEDASQLNADNFGNLDGVVFYTTGELPIDEQGKKAFLEFIRAGGGFAGVHSATDTFYEWPSYGELIGGYFDGHPWHEEVTVKVENRDHPSTRHLPESFPVTDEIYQFKNFSRDNVKVLLSLDTSSVDMEKEGVKRTDGDFALAWTNTLGEGRIFYTALGHRPEVWDDSRFQEHLFKGILWTLGAAN